MIEYNYLLEKKIQTEAPELHDIFCANIFVCQNMLNKYQVVFPQYTDHTVLHSLEVLSFCNNMIGEDIDMMNCDEIFILLMAAYLHDIGMGITKENYEEFLNLLPAAKDYIADHPKADMAEVIRAFHNDFSALYIQKYARLFDIPSDEHLFSIIEVSRGHRKTNLYDTDEYPQDCKVPNGNPIRLPYLAALIRLADELDIAVDRNLQFMYDKKNLTNSVSRLEYAKHEAIKRLTFEEDRFVVNVECDDDNIRLKKALEELFSKLDETLQFCINVSDDRTPFRIKQRSIEVVWNGTTRENEKSTS